MPEAGRQGTARARPARYAPTPWARQRLYRPFVRAALVVGLTLGFTLGAAMLGEQAAGSDAIPWAGAVQPHGVAQVFGWAGLFVFGIASHVVPRFRGNARIAFPWPQRAGLALILMAIALRAGGQFAVAGGDAAWLGAGAIAASGPALLAGVAVLAAALAGPLRRGTPSAVPFERWAWAGLAWAVVAAALHLALTARMARDGSAVASPSLDAAVVSAGTFGFLGDFLFGVSLRASAGFLRLQARRARVERVAFVAVNAGVAWTTVAAAAAAPAGVAAGGTLLWAAGAVAFAVALRVFDPARPPATRGGAPPEAPPGADAAPATYARFAWFLRAAYGWLVVAAVLLVVAAVEDLAGAARPLRALPGLHTFAMGFVTMTIFGFAARVLPLFEGRPLPMPRAMDAAFALLNASVVLRLAGGVIAAGATATLALSGVLGLAALACFAVVAWPLCGGEAGGARAVEAPVG